MWPFCFFTVAHKRSRSAGFETSPCTAVTFLPICFTAASSSCLWKMPFHVRLGGALQIFCKVPRCQQVTQPDPTKKLGADTIRNCIDDLRAVLRRIDVHAERPLAKWRIDHLHNSVRDGGDIRVGWHYRGEAIAHLVGATRIRTCFVLSDSCFVGGRTRMREMIGATGEGAGNDNRGLDPPTRQFTGVDYGQCVHPGLGREVRRQIGWRSPGGAAARYPNHKAPSLFAQLRQSCAVYTLRAQDVDVIQLRELFGRESFGWTKNHVSGIVNDHVEATVLGNDLLDGCVTGFLRRNVEFDGT